MQRIGPQMVLASVLVGLWVLAGPVLADHQALGPVEPTEQEQLGVYELNRARSNPDAYGQEIGLDLSDVAPQPALAVNKNLTGSAHFHSMEMLDHDYFGHTSAITGDGPNQMAVDNGYDLFGNGLQRDWGSTNTIESNAKGIRLFPTYPAVIETLIIDDPPEITLLGHRRHLLALAAQFGMHREVGTGRATAGDTQLYSIHTGYVNESNTFITGVVYDDRNGNLRYDAGEGLGGVTVSADGSQVTTMAEGGYSIQVDPGIYTVTSQGGDFQGPATLQVTVSNTNVGVNFQNGVPVGEVNFGWQFGAGINLTPVVNPPPSNERPDLEGTITKFKHKTKESGDKLIIKMAIRNRGLGGVVNSPFTVGLWLSDNSIFDNATKITETLIDEAEIAPGASVTTKFKLKDQPTIEEEFAFVTIDDGNAIDETDETNNTLLSTATIEGCAATIIFREQEPNAPDANQSVGKIKAGECVRIIGIIDDSEDLDSFRLTVKGAQALHAIISQDPGAGLTLDVFNVGQQEALECVTQTNCAFDVSGVEPSTLTKFDLTIIPTDGEGSYTLDINDNAAQ